MEQLVQDAFNSSIGIILTYLDEAGVNSAIKRAVKAELWDLCDRKIKPLLEQEEVEENTDGNFNR